MTKKPQQETEEEVTSEEDDVSPEEEPAEEEVGDTEEEESPEEEAVPVAVEEPVAPETITRDRTIRAFKRFAFHVRETIVKPIQQAADELLDGLEGKNGQK